MRASLRTMAAALMGLCLSVALCVPAAWAAGAMTFALPVGITAEGALPETDETYTVRMTAGDANVPMPNGQRGGRFELSIVGPREASFPPIEYDGVGVFRYTIEQIAGTHPRCAYDARIYTMKVTVTNAEGGEFDIAVALREEGKEEKPEAITFHNKYRRIPEPTTPPGTITPTGVGDDWPLYLAGSVVLLCAAGYILRVLCRKEDR